MRGRLTVKSEFYDKLTAPHGGAAFVKYTGIVAPLCYNNGRIIRNKKSYSQFPGGRFSAG